MLYILSWVLTLSQMFSIIYKPRETRNFNQGNSVFKTVDKLLYRAALVKTSLTMKTKQEKQTAIRAMVVKTTTLIKVSDP